MDNTYNRKRKQQTERKDELVRRPIMVKKHIVRSFEIKGLRILGVITTNTRTTPTLYN